jgi:hypothetical protein
MRRLMLLLALIAGLSVAAAPALGATTMHYQERGSGVSAYFSDVAFDEQGNILPGRYAETWVDAATYLTRGDGTWAFEYVCVNHSEFRITQKGEWVEDEWIGACSEAATFTVMRRLSGAAITATIPVEECLAWDDQTGECLETIVIGTFDVDLVLTGVGPLRYYHGTSSGGTAGEYQYTSHGSGVERTAEVSGSIALDGASLVDGATTSGAWLFQTKTGYMEVWH